jgi:hypothetical protein
MAKQNPQHSPRHFFLNEHHELASIEREGGGRTPQFGAIDWKGKGQRLFRSLEKSIKEVRASSDPIKDEHLFLLARPEKSIPKKSSDKKKAPQGEYQEPVRLSREHAFVFERLGADLLHIAESGEALVHFAPANAEKCLQTTSLLEQAGVREQARWVAIDSFKLIPSLFRLDPAWAKTLPRNKTADAVIELQPVLTGRQAERVMREIAALLRRENEEAIRGAGTDFSGRRWCRGRLSPARLAQIAEQFFSVQSLHAPQYSTAADAGPTARRPARAAEAVVLDDAAIARLPAVGVIDVGIPADHRALATYRRGTYTSPDGLGRPSGDHGSRVASRIVFGEQDFSLAVTEPTGPRCRFYDMNVAEYGDNIHDKSVIPAMEAIIRTAPDVRVFNLSFGARLPLSALSPKDREEALATLRDLDNLVFASDVLVVVAAGNSARGVQPSKPYPDHIDDPNWALGHWAQTFNGIVCGAYVSRAGAAGIGNAPGAPSPFTRIGPGLCRSPVPGFSAPGGDVDANYQWSAGLGEWCCNASGRWEDAPGTSFAAPLLAREAAFVFDKLQQFCEAGSAPFASLVKAFLVSTAERPSPTARLAALSERTLGFGRGRAERLDSPNPNSALMLWQGRVPGDKDILRVQVPIPMQWLKEASEPRLRLVLAWDSPVNDAVGDIWACRKVEARLRMSPDLDSKALSGTRESHRCFPLIDRTYDLTRWPDGEEPVDDQWTLEVSYSETAPYFTTIAFTPEQRVGVVAELFDADPNGTSPQLLIQRLPVAKTMTRLSASAVTTRNPVIVRTNL